MPMILTNRLNTREPCLHQRRIFCGVERLLCLQHRQEIDGAFAQGRLGYVEGAP